MKRKIVECQKKALKALAGRASGFHLTGGTALALFYFRHRLSEDLDFFTHNFSQVKIEEMMKHLENTLNGKAQLIARNLGGRTAKMMVYDFHFSRRETLKIDFVEDLIRLIKKPALIDGIEVLSLEDIYLRKIQTIAGAIKTEDETGRSRFLGRRTEAKDLYDLYYLSHTFMPLAKFMERYGDAIAAEGVIRWFRSFDRMAMMDGLLTLETQRKPDFKEIDRHFRKEIDKIIERQVGGI